MRFGLDEEQDDFWYLVCGGRGYADRATIHEVLRRLNYDSPGTVGILHGGAAGADSLADEWAKRNRIPVKAVPANWRQFGKAAGLIRNQQMLDEHPGKVLLVVAFPGGSGTRDMMERAYAAGLPVLKVAGPAAAPVSPPPPPEGFPRDGDKTPVRSYHGRQA